MRITVKTAAVILPAFFLLGIGSTMISGYWSTESSKEPVRFETGEFAGQYNPADIRGSYSFGDIETAFSIPVETTAKAFGFSEAEDPASVQAKLFEEVYGIVDGREIGTDSLRLFVALYLGLPYTPEEDTGLPLPAFNILKKEASLSEELIVELTPMVVSLEELKDVAETESAGISHEEAEETDMTVKGKTTFADLYSWGLTEDQVRDALGGIDPGTRSVAVRDYCLEIGMEFSLAKTALQEMIDAGQ